MNPLAYLLPALYAALNATPLRWAGADVPAEQHLSEYPLGPYVLLEQPTDTDAGGATACARFTCTVLLNVVTTFSKGQVTAAPAESIVSQINARLRRQRLVLGPNWDCQPGQLTPAGQLVEENGQQVILRRLLRYRWEVFYAGPLT